MHPAGSEGCNGPSCVGAVTVAYEWSIVEDAFTSLSDIIGIRKNGQLQIRSRRHKRVLGRYTSNGSIERIEAVCSDTRGDLGAESHQQRVLMRDDDAIRLSYAAIDGFLVERNDGADFSQALRAVRD